VIYQARSARLRVERASDAPEAPAADAAVALWYGGPLSRLDRAFERDGPPPRLPETAIAGGLTDLAVRVRNASPVPWSRAGAFPVRLSYRLLREGGGEPIEGSRVDLPADLPSGDPVDLVLPVAWPETPGRYVLDVDLVVDDYAWFAERVGEPLARGPVAVVPASPSR
jgi:hypothetical protein